MSPVAFASIAGSSFCCIGTGVGTGSSGIAAGSSVIGIGTSTISPISPAIILGLRPLALFSFPPLVFALAVAEEDEEEEKKLNRFFVGENVKLKFFLPTDVTDGRGDAERFSSTPLPSA